MARLIGLFMGIVVIVGGVAFPMNVLSHHAFGSEFDADRPIQLQGQIVRVEWINPHAWIHVDVTGDDGTVVPWAIQGATPNSLLRRGVTRRSVTPGTEVIVRGYRSIDPNCEPECLGVGHDITFTDGTRIFIGNLGTGAPVDFPDEEPNDADGDGVADDADNCPQEPNSDQANYDSDQSGDVCDPDDDNDGEIDENDEFPFDESEHIDTDRDGVGNNADPDDDDDGLTDVDENEVYGTDSLRRDTDGDGLDDGEEIELGLNPLDPEDCPENLCPPSSSILKLIIQTLSQDE